MMSSCLSEYLHQWSNVGVSPYPCQDLVFKWLPNLMYMKYQLTVLKWLFLQIDNIEQLSRLCLCYILWILFPLVKSGSFINYKSQLHSSFIDFRILLKFSAPNFLLYNMGIMTIIGLLWSYKLFRTEFDTKC